MVNKPYLLTVFFILIIPKIFYAQGSWEKINSPTNQFLKSVHFTDSLYGWAVGDSGTIVHTSDGGNDWVFQNSNTRNSLVDVFFLNRNLGWVLSWKIDNPPYGTSILTTTNGGQTWDSQNYREENFFMTCILFLDSLNGWMGGRPHALVRTIDGGNIWEQALIDTASLSFFPVYSIKFYNSMYGYACGGQIDVAGVTWRTSNGGDIWYPMRPEDAPADPIQELHPIDSVNVIGISGDIEGFYGIDVIRTTDGGLFWEFTTLTQRWVPLDMDFRSETEVWAPIPSGREFIISTDAGNSWDQVASPDSSAIYDVIFPDTLHGFAVGEQGSILKYKPPIINYADNQNNMISNGFVLFQNYPNPFNPSTKISFSIPENSAFISLDRKGQDNVFVILRVFDLIGNQVKTLINNRLEPGNYQVNFSGDGLPSGIYFYRITVLLNNRYKTYTITKKMLLLK